MKKILCLLSTFIIVFSTVGCDDNKNKAKSFGNTGTNTVQNVLNQKTNSTVENNKKASASDAAKSQENPETEATKTTSEYDVDLTRLNSTMIYSEVYNMLSKPESYIGKSVRMKGQFAIYHATDSEGKTIPGIMYFACTIADSTACCSQGLEFVLAGEHVYPDDYPVQGEEITVSGIFQTYDENGHTYCHLVDAVLE